MADAGYRNLRPDSRPHQAIYGQKMYLPDLTHGSSLANKNTNYSPLFQALTKRRRAIVLIASDIPPDLREIFPEVECLMLDIEYLILQVQNNGELLPYLIANDGNVIGAGKSSFAIITEAGGIQFHRQTADNNRRNGDFVT